jgi:hypothetical protein
VAECEAPHKPPHKFLTFSAQEQRAGRVYPDDGTSTDLRRRTAMKKRFLVIVALLSLVVPTAFAAPPDGKKPKPDAGTQAAQSDAERACRAEQGPTAQSIATFAEKYGTNKNKKNAFGKCVSTHAKQKA